jgi:lysine-specific demethylase/histidyl-hydroxylase NO66
MKNGENPEDILNGDDVPLVEEVVEGLLDEENGEEASKGLSVNGDNFMNTVMKMNQAQNAEENDDEPMFATSLRSSFGLKEKAKKGSKRKMKIDNGLGVVAVDEELVMKKSNKKVKAEGSVEEGKKCLAWLIHPENVDTFFDETWEKRPLHIKRRSQSQYYKHTFSTKAFDDILKQQNVQFTKNLDVTSYSEGKRETHNPEGRAYAPVVWDFYNNGCSLRMLNPQTFDDQVWKLCASLQEFFGSFVGTNLYLTPPGTQGFAPHYDDVEVFIMQLEGKKHWRLYQPRCAQETLPRFSSPNFSQDEIGKPIMDVTLEPGDLLYMPRGTIHQGNCLEDAHSLHLTVSCYQLNSMGDLLEKLLPSALKIAMEEDVEFRQGLPTNYLHYMGVAHSDRSDSQARRDFQAQIKRLMTKLCNFAPLDGAADQMGKRLMNISLPPYLTGQESARCVQAGGERWNVAKQRVVNRVEIDPETEIRLIRAHCLRLVVEEDTSIRIYYNVENTREYEEVGPQFLELDADTAPGIEALIQHYPNYVKVVDLPIEELDLKMKVVQDLWEKKLLLTKFPLEAHYDD